MPVVLNADRRLFYDLKLDLLATLVALLISGVNPFDKKLLQNSHPGPVESV